MGGSSGGSSTTVQKADPWSGVQPYLTQGYQQLADVYGTGTYNSKGKLTDWTLGSGPQYYPGQTVATPNALETTGQNMMLGNNDYANYLSGLAGSGLQSALNASGQTQGGLAGAYQGMQGLLAAGDPANNPYFQSALNAAIQPITQNFQESVLPSIRSGSIANGGLGGSRQGIAEGIASRGYLDTIANMAATMGNSAYNSGLSALNSAANIGSGLYGTGLDSAARASALAPSLMQSSYLPGQMTQQIGQQLTANDQANIDAAMNKWNYEQNLPYSMMSDYLSMLNGAQGGTTQSSMSQGGGSTLGSILGGGLAGAGLFSGTSYMLPGALGGAMLGLF